MYFICQASWHEPQAMTPDWQREKEREKRKKLINILIAKDKIQSIKKNLFSAGSNRTNFERDKKLSLILIKEESTQKKNLVGRNVILWW